MRNFNLSKVALFINLGCLVVGILTYSLVASKSAVASTVIASLCSLGGAYVCALFITKRLSKSPLGAGGTDVNSVGPVGAKLLMYVPMLLTSFEVASLLLFHGNPHSVSWVHIVAACAAGQNAEAVFRDSP